MLTDDQHRELYGESYTWADLCHTKDCTHDNPACGAWEEIRDAQMGDHDGAS